jgi:hypothetical protein
MYSENARMMGSGQVTGHSGTGTDPSRRLFVRLGSDL